MTGPILRWSQGVLALLKQGKSVHIIPSLLDTRLFRQSLGDVAGIPVLSVSKGELNQVQAAVKRAADFVLSALLLIVLSPLLGAIALAIGLTSPGPVLFRQKRLGLEGNRLRYSSSARCAPTPSRYCATRPRCTRNT